MEQLLALINVLVKPFISASEILILDPYKQTSAFRLHSDTYAKMQQQPEYTHKHTRSSIPGWQSLLHSFQFFRSHFLTSF